MKPFPFMMRMFLLSIFAAFLVSSSSALAQWYGYPATPYASTGGDFTVTKDGAPILFYEVWPYTPYAFKYDAATSSWADLASSTITATLVSSMNVRADASGTPYIAYQDGSNGGKATVQKFNGTSWANVGIGAISAGTASYVSMALGNSGNPYVAFQDAVNGDKATVMKFNGTAWVTLGGVGFSGTKAFYTSLALGKAETAYVAFCDTAGGSGNATVMKYNGTSWVTLGSFASLGPNTGNIAIVTDTSGAPVVAFADAALGSALVAMKYNVISGLWEYLNPTPIEPLPVAGSVKIAMSRANQLYVSFCHDVAPINPMTIMAYTGAGWASVGAVDLSGLFSATNTTAIAVDTAGYVYCSYAWDAIGTVMVQRVRPDSATIRTPAIVCAGDSLTMADSVAGGTWSDLGCLGCLSINAATGSVTGSNPGGVDFVTYTNSVIFGGGGFEMASVIVAPSATPLSGATQVCTGSAVLLTDSVAGGTWSSVSAGIAGVSGGMVTGIGPGTDTVKYTVSAPFGCGMASIVVTVNPTPPAITGDTAFCAGTGISLSNSLTGGAWSSGNTLVATIGSSTGIVSGIALGTAAITYTLPTGCFSIATVTVDCTTAVPQVEETKGYVIFPNPANTTLTITALGPINTISIASPTGKIVYNETDIAGNRKVIDISALPEGIYFITVNNIRTAKVIKG